MPTETPLKYHDCPEDDSWAEYDAQGIYLTRVCSKCKRAKLATYSTATLRGYSQADIDEPIEPEEYYGCEGDIW